MRPIYNPIHTSKPKTETQSNQQTQVAPNAPAKNKNSAQSYSGSSPIPIASTPALAQNSQPKTNPKPLVFREVSSQDLVNLINDKDAFNEAIQDGSIFEIRSSNANALVAACHFKKFDLAIQLLEHPLAEEAFLKDIGSASRAVKKAFTGDCNDKLHRHNFLTIVIQKIDNKTLAGYIEEHYEPFSDTFQSLFNFAVPSFIEQKDFEGLKKFKNSFDKVNQDKCSKYILQYLENQLGKSENDFFILFDSLVSQQIIPKNQLNSDFYKSCILNRIGFNTTDLSPALNLLEKLNNKGFISSKDSIEASIIDEILNNAFLLKKLDFILQLLDYSKSKRINVFDSEEKQEKLRGLLYELGEGLSSQNALNTLSKKIEAIFSYIQYFEPKNVLNRAFIDSFFKGYQEWQPLQADYYNRIFDEVTRILGEEYFKECIEKSSQLSLAMNGAYHFKKNFLFEIKSLIQRGANPMAKIDQANPRPLLNLDLSLEVHRSLAQSQHPAYKQFELSTIFGLKSAKLIGGNPTASVPIIEKNFEAFLKAFPTSLDSGTLERVKQASAQAVSFQNRKDLLEYFVKNPDDSEAIQVAYLNTDKHAYAYLIYKDILIETQRAQETSLLEGSDNELFYFTNASSFDTKKVRAIQVLPIDKKEAKLLLKKTTIEKSDLRLGNNNLESCKANVHPIDDLNPLLEGLGTETSWSIIKDPNQQKKVALAEILTTLGYSEDDGSGATIDAFKDKDSSQIAQDVARVTNLHPQTLTSWLDDNSISKVDCLKNILNALGITKKSLYYLSDADRKDSLAAIAFEKTPQKTGNCYFATPLLNMGGLMWWATVLEKAKQQEITIDRPHMAQNPEFYKAIYKEVEPTYKEFVKFMKLNIGEDYRTQFGKLSDPALQAELDEKLAKLQNLHALRDSDEDL